MESRLVNAFFAMVRISSESGAENEFIAYLKDLFTKELHAECTIDDYGNLIAKIPPKKSDRTEPVLFGAHADTVSPGLNIEPVLENGIIRSRGNTVLGADDKAGIAELIEAIRTAARHPPLEIVVTREEEVGLSGAKHVDVSCLKSRIGFVLDMEGLDAVVVGGPSKMSIDVAIKGKAAHAAMEPEKGVSAIKAACHAISLLKEGWIDEETTVNVGVMEGGTVRNSVPEEARIKAECRSLTHEKCVFQSELIKETFETAARSIGARAEVKTELAYRAVRIPHDSVAVKIAKEALRSIGQEPNVRLICGGTDASIYNEKGIQTVALGTGVTSEHSKDENISVADMGMAVNVIRHVLHTLSSKE